MRIFALIYRAWNKRKANRNNVLEVRIGRIYCLAIGRISRLKVLWPPFWDIDDSQPSIWLCPFPFGSTCQKYSVAGYGVRVYDLVVSELFPRPDITCLKIPRARLLIQIRIVRRRKKCTAFVALIMFPMQEKWMDRGRCICPKQNKYKYNRVNYLLNFLEKNVSPIS